MMTLDDFRQNFLSEIAIFRSCHSFLTLSALAQHSSYPRALLLVHNTILTQFSVDSYLWERSLFNIHYIGLHWNARKIVCFIGYVLTFRGPTWTSGYSSQLYDSSNCHDVDDWDDPNWIAAMRLTVDRRLVSKIQSTTDAFCDIFSSAITDQDVWTVSWYKRSFG